MTTRVPARIVGAESVESQTQRLLTRSRVAKIRARQKAEKAALAAEILTDDQVLAKLKLEEEDIEQLKRISRGRGGRHSMAQISALKMRAEHTLAKPKQELGIEGGVEVVVKSLARATAPAELGTAAPTTPEKQTYTLPATATVVHAETGTYTTVTADIEGDTCES
jgi:hypothetical protein